MSITRDILNGVRSGLNTVLSKIAADDTPISYVEEEAFQRELMRRAAARQSSTIAPMDNPRARLASASPEARQQRSKLAEERAARFNARRSEKARAAKAAQDEAFRRAKEQAARSTGGSARPRPGPSATGRASTGSGARQRAGGGFPFQRQDDKLAESYKVLDLPYGASFDEIKSSYRQLMRKYHPDRHAGSPKKQKAATELTIRVTQAYNVLEMHHKKK